MDKLKLGFMTMDQLAWATKSDAVQDFNKAITNVQKKATEATTGVVLPMLHRKERNEKLDRYST